MRQDDSGDGDGARAAERPWHNALWWLDRIVQGPVPAFNERQGGCRERSEAEALGVVDNATDRRVVGVLTEAQALRCYSEELDQRHRELAGETWYA